MDRVVLADAGPLIHLAQIQNGLSWLELLFGPVAITSIVRAEVLPGRHAPGEEKIAQAIQRGILYEIAESSSEALTRLGPGEASTIRVALDLVEAGRPSLVVMDDRKGRKFLQALRSPSIDVVGTGAVVAIAKEKGLIPFAAEVFNELRQNGLYTSKGLLNELLARVGETYEPEMVGSAPSPRKKPPRKRRR